MQENKTWVWVEKVQICNFKRNSVKQQNFCWDQLENKT